MLIFISLPMYICYIYYDIFFRADLSRLIIEFHLVTRLAPCHSGNYVSAACLVRLCEALHSVRTIVRRIIIKFLIYKYGFVWLLFWIHVWRLNSELVVSLKLFASVCRSLGTALLHLFDPWHRSLTTLIQRLSVINRKFSQEVIRYAFVFQILWILIFRLANGFKNI